MGGPRFRPVNADLMWNLTCLTPRTIELRRQHAEAPVVICPEDSFLFTESYKETVGLPETLRYAYAYEKIVENCPILIRKEELIVGSLTKEIRGANLIAAECPANVLDSIASGGFTRKMSEWTKADISEEDMVKLKADAEYWMERVPEHEVNKLLVHEFGEEHMDLMMDRAMIFEGIPFRAETEMGLWGPIFPERIGRGTTSFRAKPVHVGLNHIIDLCEKELVKMDTEGYYPGCLTRITPAYKRCLIRAMIICAKATIRWAERHAEEARRMAALPENAEYKDVLLQIAENCDWVPANPPRTYWEAVQSYRFLNACDQKIKPYRKDTCLGRLDQILYPYYEADLQAGKITREFAAEILGCFFIKLREGEGFDPEKREVAHSQGTFLPDITICGRDEQGRDMTNEMSYLVLRVMADMKFNEPTIYIRCHDGMSDDFYRMAVKANMEHRGGCPAFLNDELGTRRYLDRGVALEDACDWNCSGCLAYHLDCAEHTGGFMHLNLLKCFEMAMRDGYEPRWGKQFGPHTGDFTKMKSVDEILEAWYKQIDYFCDLLNRDYAIRRSLELSYPLVSGLNGVMWYDYALEYGEIPVRGGTPYPITEAMWLGNRGQTDVADCLAAIQKVVFDDKKATLADVLDACNKNFEGYEDLQQMLLNAPKYGNDDDYVDDIFVKLCTKVDEIMTKRPDPINGQKVFLFKGAASAHVVYGMVSWALPNGRNAGVSCNDGAVSAMPGMDIEGPTALINSASKFDFWQYAGGVLNMKFTKDLLDSPEKIDKVIALIKTFHRRGGWHVQFNIHSQEDLVAARHDPENWKDLLVRVGGYSANFVDLPLPLQDEIIHRTPHAV
ncbi:MAG: hypothetical protein IKD96_04890 [Oscillospiraceae bacterium]|nr:hypothetical protein [Oscillospiraceae bacterium]